MVVPSPMNSDMSKQALRQHLREKRDAYVRTLSADERTAAEFAACARLAQILGPGIWASYIAIGSEISAAALPALAPAGQPIGYPWFADRAAAMLFRLSGEDFVAGPFGIRQPEAARPEAEPDWVIVPLVGVDRHGNRIGQGAGHYDRALARLQAIKPIRTIGLAWDVQLVDSIPADPWDQPLDLIVTPTRIIETRA